jgi:hypothetical protein
MRRLRYVAPAAALLLALAACGDDEPAADPAPTDSPSPTATSSDAAPEPSSPAPTSSGPAVPEGGTAEKPAVVTAETRLLDWKPVAGPIKQSVTRSGDWTLTVNASSTGYSLEGPNSSSGSGSGGGSGSRVSDAFIDGTWAVVVMQDEAEQRPSTAEVTELATGKTFTIDARSDVPTTTGGSWALGEGHVLHATISKGAYCLASVDLATQESTLGWCAPKRTGFNGIRITPAGDAMLTFDDSRPSCRTLVSVTGAQTEPFDGVTACKGWDGLLTDDGAVWSDIPKESRTEAAHFHARVGDGYFDLGPGTSGSLLWCGGASYFVRDPQREGDPAALMRWTAADGLSVVYESPGGQAFLGEPRCGGDTVTVTALAEDGDEQVSASLS